MKRPLCPRCANPVKRLKAGLQCVNLDCMCNWESDGDLEADRLNRYEAAMNVKGQDPERGNELL